MTLQLLISTIDNGINKVAAMLLDPVDNVSYLVSWQHSNDERHELPAALVRNDVQVVHLQGRGLSRNRNNCLKHATADVCLIADDDCRYTHNQLNAVALTFATHRKVDIATFKVQGINVEYPTQSFNLRERRKNYHARSIEIAFRRQSVQGRLWFNELFGLGAPELHCGEEEIFVHDAVTMGMECVYFPCFIVTHEGDSTSVTRVGSRGTLMARGAYLYTAYRSTMLRRAVLISYRLHRDHGVPFFYALRNIVAGIRYIKKSHMQDANLHNS